MRTRIIAVSGGKGGVGKTQVAINLAVSLARSRQRVLLLDGDLGLANVDIALGLHPKLSLQAVLNGAAKLEETFLEGPYGLKVVAGVSGLRKLANLSMLEQAQLIHAFEALDQEIDYLIIDTAAGIHENVLQYLIAAEQILLVMCNDPASIADAYALIKVLNKDFGINRFYLLANRVATLQEGNELFAKINKVASQFLSVALHPLGVLPEDQAVGRALKMRKAVVEVFPSSPIGRAYQRVNAKILHMTKERNVEWLKG